MTIFDPGLMAFLVFVWVAFGIPLIGMALRVLDGLNR